MPSWDRRYAVAFAMIAVAYMYYKYRSSQSQSDKEQEAFTNVQTKFETKIIPLKPPTPTMQNHETDNDMVFRFTSSNSSNNCTIKFKVVTFNTLATCYCNSSKTYREYCDKEYLNGKYRYKMISSILSDCDADLIALQEVDKPNETIPMLNLNRTKYCISHAFRTGKKMDGSLIAFNKSKFELFYNKKQSHFVIELNDLCLGVKSRNSKNYFKQNQIAIYVILKCIQNPNKIVIFVNNHLYWHPLADDLRLKQIYYTYNVIKYEIDKLLSLNAAFEITPIFVGDYNTLPDNPPHSFILNGQYTMIATGNSKLKLIMDNALNKVAKWCRSLGVDTAHFPSPNMDTANASKLFEIANNEKRIIVTRSKSLTARRECPKQHLLLDNHNPKDNLKQIIKYFGIQYNDQVVFTRCTLCNGLFRQIDNDLEIQNSEKIPDALKNDYKHMGNDGDDIFGDSTGIGKGITFWECVDCKQVYWWGTKTESGVKHFKNTFNEIELQNEIENNFNKSSISNLMNGLRVSDCGSNDGDLGKRERESKSNDDVDDGDSGGNGMSLDMKLSLLPNLQRFFWKDVTFINPVQGIRCSYQETHLNLSPEYTNKTSNFQGCLDYIFYQNEYFKCVKSNVIQGNKQAYPNKTWPSDHCLLVATFQSK